MCKFIQCIKCFGGGVGTFSSRILLLQIGGFFSSFFSNFFITKICQISWIYTRNQKNSYIYIPNFLYPKNTKKWTKLVSMTNKQGFSFLSFLSFFFHEFIFWYKNLVIFPPKEIRKISLIYTCKTNSFTKLS